jgi:hypothetical protein
MQLIDTEIRDINRYLAESKPLPDKYRFLLFVQPLDGAAHRLRADLNSLRLLPEPAVLF